MAKVVAGMTMSLDGFVRDRDGSIDALYPDLDALRATDFLQESIRNTGAVVMGWNAFAMAKDPDWFAGNYEYQVPIFVLTHGVPKRRPKEAGPLSFTFVTDGISSAIRQAQEAAGDKEVTVIGGASTIQQCLRAGLVDELHVDIMPILLCGGLELFTGICMEPIQLEKKRVLEGPDGRIHLEFRIVGRAA